MGMFAKPKTTMITLKGKPFRCECGCNVFTKKRTTYTCNGCQSTYTTKASK